MSDLRERFRALDDLDVPDVMSRARRIGIKRPEPDATPPLRRIGALAFAAVVAIVAAFLIARALNEPTQPADPPTPTPTPSGTTLRRDGEVIKNTAGPFGVGDLVAQNPETGEERLLVDRSEVGGHVGFAAWSADGRWLAFENVGCDDGSARGETAGLWVTNGLEEPRQVTTRPCSEDPRVHPYDEHWEWSPAGAQLAVARRTVGRDALVLIDAATDDRTDLGEAAGDVTSLAWSPDGTRITYGAVPAGTSVDYSAAEQGSVYSVSVGGGDHALLAASVGLVSGGETGSGIRWSPDGSRIAVLTESGGDAANRLYLMNADGSDLRLLTEGVVIAHTLGSPDLVWSADGTRMAYATFSGGDRDPQMHVWNQSPDASEPILVFESSPEANIWLAGGPVWSPDGTRIAFRFSTTDDQKVYLIANADGTGNVREIDQLQYLSWRGGWYFCECYG
jgi:Tol biopolymer transport system component